MKTLDLSEAPPRSCYVELDGLMLMPRTIDKLRAQLPGGNAGGYFINGTQMKGISGYLLDRLGVREAELLKTIGDAADENTVAAWLRERTDAEAYPAINETLRRIKPKHSENEALFREEYVETLREQPELEYIVDIIDADDRRRFQNDP
jgi:hypothetical protein